MRAQWSEGTIHSKEQDRHFILGRSNQNLLKVLVEIDVTRNKKRKIVTSVLVIVTY
jgi:hypothetical protein